MNKYIAILSFVIFNHLLVLGQVETLIDNFEDSLSNIQTLTYTATFLRKKPASDKFIEKTFQIYAKRNSSNKAYNFDWELVEQDSIYEFRSIFIAEDSYYVVKPSKIIRHEPKTKKLSKGDYKETMRRHSLFDEILYGLDLLYKDLPKDIVNSSESEKYEILKIKLNETEEKFLKFNKKNMFLEEVNRIIYHKELNLTSTYKTNLSNIKINSTLPDSVLNPKYYIDLNYKVNVIEQITEADKVKEKEISQTRRKQQNTPEQINTLLNTPLYKSSGDSLKISQINADLLLIDFWYLSCAPCLKSIPYLQKLEDKYKTKGFKVVGVNTHDSFNKENAVQKLKDSGISYTCLFSSKNLRNKLHIYSYPTFLLINKKGDLIYTGYGIYDDTKKDMEAMIEKYLSNKNSLK